MTREEYIYFCRKLDKSFKALSGDPATPATSPRARSSSPGSKPRKPSRDQGRKGRSPKGKARGKGRQSRTPSPTVNGKKNLCREYYWTGHCRFQTNGKTCALTHMRKDEVAKDPSKYEVPRAWVSSSKKGAGKRGKRPSRLPRTQEKVNLRGKGEVENEEKRSRGSGSLFRRAAGLNTGVVLVPVQWTRRDVMGVGELGRGLMSPPGEAANESRVSQDRTSESYLC